ncbi:GNAT family N-acetyltransferase [Peribacillus sp. FSL H8-0477]|uniref:GNAT family N-acetyltransferase n=1 Tax=Peribacillus sp. FSL H8-0477 TaxID=2921388 RepID=UPI0030F6B6EF
MNAILKEFPEVIESDRIYLRPCRREDSFAVHAAIHASQQELKQWLAFAKTLATIEETAENLIQSQADFILRKDLRFLIFRKEDDVFIGSTGLHRINWDIPKFEIGYWIDTQYSKQGYITESTKALTNFAFEQLGAKRIEIRCDSKNTESRRIPEKLGFSLEGILRSDSLAVDGSVRDTCIFAKTTAGS